MLSARSEYFRNSKLPAMITVSSCSYLFILVFANKSAFNEVLNVTSIEEDLGSMSMGPGGLGNKITDEDSDDGDKDLASPNRRPQEPKHLQKPFIRSSDGVLTAMTMKRRVVRVSDASHVTYQTILHFLYTGRVPDSPTLCVV